MHWLNKLIPLFGVNSLFLGVVGYISLDFFSLDNTRNLVEMLILVLIFDTYTGYAKAKATGAERNSKIFGMVFNKIAQYYFVLITGKFIDGSVGFSKTNIGNFEVSLYHVTFVLIILAEAKSILENFQAISDGANRTVLTFLAGVINKWVLVIQKITDAGKKSVESKEEVTKVI